MTDTILIADDHPLFRQAIALAVAARGEDPYGYRNEAVTLMRLAASLARQ